MRIPRPRPLALDLCCGLGGWARGLIAAGWDVIGVDVEPRPTYPGRFLLRDVRELDGKQFLGVQLVVASPPCEEFSRHDQPWTRMKNPPEPSLEIVEACRRIAREAEAPLVLENVRGAQKWLGKAVARWGSCYLWGDGVPLLIPQGLPKGGGKQQRTSKARLERALVPLEMAMWVGSCSPSDPLALRPGKPGPGGGQEGLWADAEPPAGR